jgi:hypothetical protein
MSVKSSPSTCHEGAWGERRYGSYSFSTLALDRGEWSASRPGRALPPVPIVQEAGWAPELAWTQRLEEKSFRLCRASNLDRPEYMGILIQKQYFCIKEVRMVHAMASTGK